MRGVSAGRLSGGGCAPPPRRRRGPGRRAPCRRRAGTDARSSVPRFSSCGSSEGPPHYRRRRRRDAIIAEHAPLGHARPAARQPPAVGHRPLQSALPLLHAGGRVPLAAARGRADVRGDQPAGGSVRRGRRRSAAADRRRAAAPPRSAVARRRAGRRSPGCATWRSRPTACCWPTRRPT